MDTKEIFKYILDFFAKYGDEIAASISKFFINILVALFIFMVGFRVVTVISNLCKKGLDKLSIESEVKTFLLSFVKIGLKALVIIWAITVIGVPNSSIIALFGTASVSIGLALQGGLSNVVGGLIILLIKPFKIGDYVIFNSTAVNNEGTVMEIDIFYTRLQSIDNKTIVVPNGLISNATLTNVTKEEERRIDLLIPVGYQENISQVKTVLEYVVSNEAAVLRDEQHEMSIFVSELGAHSIQIGMRFWVPTEEYWNIRWRVLEEIKNRFEENGISIPFNQLDVHVKTERT